jgi:hypothetical protein
MCSCWDTVFKAGYEAGFGNYKHFYFNATQQALAVWTITVVAVILAYESIRRVFILLYNGDISMFRGDFLQNY